MIWWLWLVIGFVLVALEMFVPAGFALLIIGLSFVITGVTTSLGLNDPEWVEWCICFISFVVLFSTIRKPLMRIFGLDAPSNYKEIEGQDVKIISTIAPGTSGQGEMQGSQWKVRNIGEVQLNPGDIVRAIKVDGLTVEVKK